MLLPAGVCWSQREVPGGKDVSVSFFVGSCACHLWALLLCFLVCFDVFAVLFFGNHAISLRLLICL